MLRRIPPMPLGITMIGIVTASLVSATRFRRSEWQAMQATTLAQHGCAHQSRSLLRAQVVQGIDEQGGGFAITGVTFANDPTAIAKAEDKLRYAAGKLYSNCKTTGAVIVMGIAIGSLVCQSKEKACFLCAKRTNTCVGGAVSAGAVWRQAR